MRLQYIVPAIMAVSCAPAESPPEQVSTTATIHQARDVAPISPDSALRVSLAHLVAGGRAQAGEQTWFSAKTSHVVSSVTVDGSGHAIINFHDLAAVIPNASSSAGSTMLLEELNTAVFSVPQIRTVQYRMEGSCDRFWNWLQYGCRTVTRP
jgi:hypothetical protein